MVRLLTIVAIVLSAGLSAFADTGAPAGQPTFELTHVTIAPKSSFTYSGSSAVRGGRYEFRHATMVDLISAAYSVTADKVIGGPSWLELDKFDVLAKFPKGASSADMKLMLRELLADRFGLTIHTDSRPMPAYLLKADKRNLLKASSEVEEKSGCKDQTPEPKPGEQQQVPLVAYECHNMTMAAFAAQMHDMRSSFSYIGDNPVVDLTGLTGAFDFSLQYHQRARVNQAGVQVVTMADSLAKLGLKLESGTTPMDVYVVDKVNKVPTSDTPEAAKAFPSQPLEFDVADLKPSNPDFKGNDFQLQPGGRLTIHNWRLLWYVEEAFNFQDDDRVVDGPKFLNSDLWDLVAKAPAGMASTAAKDSLDQEVMDGMLKSLMIDRFHLKAHMEERSMQGWSLTAVKPKLKKADPRERTKCTEGVANLNDKDPRNNNPVLGRLLTCQNVSMKYLAEQLQNFANGYIHSEILDSTGLEGGWDFTLSFSTIGQLNGGNAGATVSAAQGGQSAPSEPNGAISLQDAIDRQLGLKLVSVKRSLPVLVIDHIDQKPVDN